jgi:hypothetical protein
VPTNCVALPLRQLCHHNLTLLVLVLKFLGRFFVEKVQLKLFSLGMLSALA